MSIRSLLPKGIKIGRLGIDNNVSENIPNPTSRYMVLGREYFDFSKSYYLIPNTKYNVRLCDSII